jgi:hypothetical protein
MTLEYCPSAAFVHYYIRNTQNDVGAYRKLALHHNTDQIHINKDLLQQRQYASVAETLKFEPFIDVINCATKKTHIFRQKWKFSCVSTLAIFLIPDLRTG